MSTLRFIVSGRVQGVSFRAGTRDKAQELGVRGYARNLADGRVEVLASGSDAAVEELALWLHRGPPMARVDGLERLAAAGEEAGRDFAIR